ncbi:hypothetical protein phytr_10410 [Candidatus Phycorickettsia trachydisci]|uniref:Uncharacterized protein n=1 Tax=Candidatus Phycorickettsia trachydisci TaxID=2115978 RepID=A0A2P1P9N2_9RICK|nr:hypothetical protein phytr_10410 [Candidatus Phycorickettsia trachydisci]
MLLSKGSDLDSKLDNNKTSLHLAAENGRTEVVKLLLAKGADKQAQDKDGHTPLELAEKNGNPEIIQLLKGDKDTDMQTIQLAVDHDIDTLDEASKGSITSIVLADEAAGGGIVISATITGDEARSVLDEAA